MFNDFSGSICSGYIAGDHAARAAGSTYTELPEPDADELGREKRRVFKPLGVSDGIRQDKFEAAIRQVMDYYMGYVRNEKGMSTALEKFALIESVEDTIMAKNLHELLRAHEAMHLLRTCRLTTLATRERRETGRSVYRRTDYPDMDPSLNKLLVLEKDAYGPKAFWAGAPQA